MKSIGESVCRIVFGGLFFMLAIAVSIFADSEFWFVVAVILINALLCCVSGIVNIVKINAENAEWCRENERVLAARQAQIDGIVPEIDRCRTMYSDEIMKYEGKVDMLGNVMKNDVWYEYVKVLCNGVDLVFIKGCTADRVCSGGIDNAFGFNWAAYSFEDDVVFRCRVNDIVFFKHADEGSVNGKVILRVNNEQVVFTNEAYNIFMCLVPQKEFDYIVATQSPSF